MSEPAKEEEKKPLTTEELLAKLAADSYENRRAINAIAEAMVKLKQDIDTLKGGGGTGGAGAPQPDAVAGLLKAFGLTEEKGSVESLVKQAESMAKLAENLDRFRHPLDVEGLVAKRLLWRQGLRSTSGLPRYMTKEELKRYDKILSKYMGLEEFEEEEEGETEHVK